MKSMKGKTTPKVKEIKFDTMQGKDADGIHYVLWYNSDVKRYTLAQLNDDSTETLVLSHISLVVCQNKAKDKGITWKEKSPASQSEGEKS